MRYRQRITLQAPTEVRSPAGGVSYTYENVAGLTDLPASKATVAFDERRQDRMTPTEELLTFVVAGDHRDITDAMALLDGEAVYDVVRIEPLLGRRDTLVIARQVAL